MSDAASEKRKLIEQMLEMQKKFIEFEHKNGVQPQEYWMSQEGHPLYQYKDKYEEMSARVIDLAHAEKDSKR